MELLKNLYISSLDWLTHVDIHR